MAERVVLTIGTRKGVFVADAAKPRRSFALRGPFGPGVPVYSTLIDTRGTPLLYASSCNPFFGMKVLRSKDLGKSFQEAKSAPAFPKDDGRALINIWSLEPGAGKKELWCGVEPASLFRSIGGPEYLAAILAQIVAAGRDAEVDAIPIANDRVHAHPAGTRLPLARVFMVADALNHFGTTTHRPALHAESRRMGGLDWARRTATGHRHTAQ